AMVWRKRAVWLACLFAAELFTFTALTHFQDAIQAVVVLSLFIPLCISTGGNSGSQAATLLTRAMALGHLSTKDWARVLRHELAMGLAVGATLGLIGYARAWFTSSDVLTNTTTRAQPFLVKMPKDKELTPGSDGKIEIPAKAEQRLFLNQPKPLHVTLPKG